MKLFHIRGVDEKTGESIYEAFFVNEEEEARQLFFSKHPEHSNRIELINDVAYEDIM